MGWEVKKNPDVSVHGSCTYSVVDVRTEVVRIGIGETCAEFFKIAR